MKLLKFIFRMFDKLLKLIGFLMLFSLLLIPFFGAIFCVVAVIDDLQKKLTPDEKTGAIALIMLTHFGLTITFFYWIKNG